MNITRTIAAIVFATATLPAKADFHQFLLAPVLYKSLASGKAGNVTDEVTSRIYVMSASDALNSAQLICSKEGTTAPQTVDIVFSYLKANLAEITKDKGAAEVIYVALVKAFPCKASRK